MLRAENPEAFGIAGEKAIKDLIYANKLMRLIQKINLFFPMNRSIPSRKPQGNSVLEAMTLAQKERLAGWLLGENLGYTVVRERLREEFGVATSRTALCRYFQRWLAPRLEAAHAGDERAETVEAWRGVDAKGLEEATIAQGRYLAFDAITRREPDLQTAERSLELVNQLELRRIEQERLALEERRMELAERRAGWRERTTNADGGARNVASAERGTPSAAGMKEAAAGDCSSIFNLVQADAGGFREEKIIAGRTGASGRDAGAQETNAV